MRYIVIEKKMRFGKMISACCVFRSVRKVAFIAIIILMMPFITYGSSIDTTIPSGNGKVASDTAKTITDQEVTGSPDSAANSDGKQGSDLKKQQTSTQQDQDAQPKASDAASQPANINDQQGTSPATPPVNRIPPPIRPRNLNLPIAQQLQNAAPDNQKNIDDIKATETKQEIKPAQTKPTGSLPEQVTVPNVKFQSAETSSGVAIPSNLQPVTTSQGTPTAANPLADSQKKTTDTKAVDTKPAEMKQSGNLPGQVPFPPNASAPYMVQSPSGVSIPLNPPQATSPQAIPQQFMMPPPQLNTSPKPPGEIAPPNMTMPQLPAADQNRASIVSKENVSLSFDDADIYSVIQTVFSEILKVNYIIDSRVKGRVTFRSVAPVPREKVLPLMEVILRLNGVAIIEESELYRIIPISDLSREPSEIKIGRKIIEADLKGKAVLQIVPLNYVQSSEIVKLINPFVSTNAVIVDVPKANHIILVDTDANVKRILHLIEYFDVEMKEKKGVRVFVYHVQNTMSKDIVNMLQQIFLGAKATTTDRVSKPSTGPTSVAPAAPQIQPVMISTHTGGGDAVVSDVVKIFADEKLNAVVILGTREDYDIIKETIKELDLVPRQVLIEGTIASIQLTDKMSLGLAWSIKTNISSLDPVNISLNPTALDIDPAKPTTAGLNLIGVDSAGSVRAVINALASQSKAKLLASPHIMVSDNNEARIQVGQQVPIPTSETYGTTGVTPMRTIQYKDIGIILKVKPLINDSGLVNLQISQEVSTYSTIVLYSDEQQIILNKTEATTNLVVKNGHTVVIGGLIREDDSKARAGIPWLTKIPILGYLFGNTTNENNRTELVILLTPYIIKDQEDAISATDKFTNKISDEKMNKELKESIHRGMDASKEGVQKK